MRRPLIAAATAALAMMASPAGSAWTFAAAPDVLRSHMAYLASDELKGRDAGTEGYDLAAAYVARQFQEMGLKPGGAGGSYLQPVGLIRHRPLNSGSFRIAGGPEGAVELVEWRDFRAGTQAHGKTVSRSGPAVFVGHGVVRPGQDDYRGLDVKGKIVVALDGGPDVIPSGERNYVTSARAKALMAERRGAVGLVLISLTDVPAQKPAADARLSWSWESAAGDAGYAGVPVLATLDRSGAEKLFDGAQHSFEAVLAAGERPPRFDLRRRIEASAEGELGERRKSSNVVAIIEGSDRRLRGQYIVMSGHLDHVGVAASPVNGDSIFNGALDNAGGIATLIEAARGFAEGPRPKRSVIFLAVTGEEKGLIGADYFVRHPTVPKSAIVGNVNLDMPVMTYDFVDVAAIGSERSTILRAVERAARRMGVGLSPDPVPELGIFTRSDHYRFVEQGIPATFLIGGFKNGGEAKFRDFYANRYHKVGDDLSQAIDYEVAAKWARLNYEIAWELASQNDRPKFNKGDLFGTRFAGPEAIAR